MGTLEDGTPAYVDDDATIEQLPDTLKGQVMVRGADDRTKEGQMVNIFQTTAFPATSDAGQIVLTWSEDPKTTQSVQWRTNLETDRGTVSYWQKGDTADRWKPHDVPRIGW